MGDRKKVFKIEPFKHRVEMDPNYADKTWKVLEDAIKEINNHNASGLSFEELYRSAYNMVLHRFGDRLYNGLVDTITRHLRGVVAVIEGTQQGGLFLVELNKRWADHNKSVQMTRDILMYMDRTYVTQHHKTPVLQLGLNLWRDEVVRCPAIHDRLQTTLLREVHRERLGEVVDRGLLRAVISMLSDLGPDIYQDEFEAAFLAAASEFYTAEAAQLIHSCSCADYLRKAEARLAQEMERVAHYLDASTEPKITAVVERQMIGAHMQTLVTMENSGLLPMLVDNKFEDLRRMYTLFRRIPEGLSTMRSMMADYLKETGKELVTNPERSKDPVDYVQQLLAQKDKFHKIISTSLHNDKSFQNALNQAFETFINLNPRSPEFLSLYVDEKLRKGLKGVSEEDVETTLDKVVMLFRYLQEKDVFEKYYKQHLAKRLLLGRSISDDAERSLILKLKTECGYQFTSKLEGMFTDIHTSEDTMLAFRQHLQDTGASMGGIDINVQVLTTVLWPVQPMGADSVLPPELAPCCECFKTFYLSKHTGRRLTWQTNMGTADIKATFANGARHELNVSTYQMCILLLFNTADELSYRDIARATDIPGPDLVRNLQSLACVKGKNVLKKNPVGRDVDPEDVFSVNDTFTSKLYKVKVGTVIAQKESEPEKVETRAKVEEDRKPQIEAAIVRIMKSRRVLDHNNVVAEVTRQLGPRFVPKPAVIKTRIESLIEREFLERDKNDRRLYRYLAKPFANDYLASGQLVRGAATGWPPPSEHSFNAALASQTASCLRGTCPVHTLPSPAKPVSSVKYVCLHKVLGLLVINDVIMKENRAVIDGVLSVAECQELCALQRCCGVVGYRPAVSSVTLLDLHLSRCHPLMVPLLRARDKVRAAVEGTPFGAACDLFVEFTGLLSWSPGSAIDWHADNNRPYLRQRHISAVCYLNDSGADFQGGDFHFQDGEPSTIVPRAGTLAVYTSGEENVHCVDEISHGERLTLVLWFATDASFCEDARMVARLVADAGATPRCCPPLPTGLPDTFYQRMAVVGGRVQAYDGSDPGDPSQARESGCETCPKPERGEEAQDDASTLMRAQAYDSVPSAPTPSSKAHHPALPSRLVTAEGPQPEQAQRCKAAGAETREFAGLPPRAGMSSGPGHEGASAQQDGACLVELALHQAAANQDSLNQDSLTHSALNQSSRNQGSRGQDSLKHSALHQSPLHQDCQPEEPATDWRGDLRLARLMRLWGGDAGNRGSAALEIDLVERRPTGNANRGWSRDVMAVFQFPLVEYAMVIGHANMKRRPLSGVAVHKMKQVQGTAYSATQMKPWTHIPIQKGVTGVVAIPTRRHYCARVTVRELISKALPYDARMRDFLKNFRGLGAVAPGNRVTAKMARDAWAERLQHEANLMAQEVDVIGNDDLPPMQWDGSS
eukprot:jgi/Mesvir1/27684/Mv07403-RA.1